MRLDDFKKAQVEEIMGWANDLESIITPDSIQPIRLREFPLAINTCDQLKRICKWKSDELHSLMQLIEDDVLTTIEDATFIFKFNGGGQPVMKKKYPSAEKRERELRKQLTDNEHYNKLKQEQFEWGIMYGNWIDKSNQLRREFRLLEVNYQSAGGDGIGL